MSTFAVIATGGKQYTVSEGDTLRIEKLTDQEEGSTVSFPEVLLVAESDGSSVSVGAPTLKGATVEATVTKVGRAKKVMVKKFKAKTRYARTRGHRQHYTEVKITSVSNK